jgi:hypothetical protein
MDKLTPTLTQNGLLAVLQQRQRDKATASARRRTLARRLRDLLYFRASPEYMVSAR